MSTTLRSVTALDLPVLEGLHGESFPDDPWSARALGKLLATPGTGGLLAEAEGEPLGFLLWRCIAGEAEILTLCVRPTARRRNLATELLKASIATLQQSTASRLLLEVAEDNAGAQQLYKRLGFCEIGRRRGYYRRSGSSRIDALLLQVTLKTG